MRSRIKATNFKQTEASKVLVEEKLVAPIAKFLGALDDQMDLILEVEIAKSTKHHKEGRVWECEVNLDMPHMKTVLRAKNAAESLEEAVNITKSKLVNEIKKYKSKPGSKNKKVRRAAKYGVL
ncbi:MAG: HPF/RaiA family ribosome-associated protein [Candidatus Niyogibacteria bacterium]|nr:HPF/RaiA family ribosome-associated protein [Candidatus Niyogibacteria bacterium]